MQRVVPFAQPSMGGEMLVVEAMRRVLAMLWYALVARNMYI